MNETAPNVADHRTDIQELIAEANYWCETAHLRAPGSGSHIVRQLIQALTDAESRITALTTGWEYAAGCTAIDGAVFPLRERGYLKFVAEADVAEHDDPAVHLVRRRKASPWEEAPAADDSGEGAEVSE